MSDQQSAPATQATGRSPKTMPKTRAHSAAQLRQALEWTADQWARGQAVGLIPPCDMKTPRWSGGVVNELLARRDELTAALPDWADQDQVRARLDVDFGQWRRGSDAAVIPGPDRGGAWWSRELVDELVARRDQIVAAIPSQPLGERRCAELLTELTGLEVAADDIAVLAERGATRVVGDYKGCDLYDVDALKALADERRRGPLVEVVGERQAWLAASMTTADAATWLDWREEDLPRVARERGISAGRFGRWARVDIAALTEDEELVEQVRRERLLGPEQAATHLEMRRRDFEYVLAAGWVSPASSVERRVGVRKSVTIPLYRVGDLEDVLDTPGVDWEAVRAVRPGEPSPLREWARLPAQRADVVRAFCGQLGEEWGVEVWPHFFNAGDCWEIDWEYRADGHPTLQEVQAALTAHHGVGAHRSSIALSTRVGEVIRMARDCLQPGVAVVVDTETSDLDGVVIELAVVDACDGTVLLDTLVNPAGVAVCSEARAVHRIDDESLAAAPRWEQVLPQFTAAVGERRLLAFNAPFDCARIAATHHHAGLDPALLPAADRWECLMEARRIWARVGRWTPLGGGHRARADAMAARTVLQTLATPIEGTR